VPDSECGRLDGEAPESGSQVTMRPWAWASSALSGDRFVGYEVQVALQYEKKQATP